jgi:hypothetical protein
LLAVGSLVNAEQGKFAFGARIGLFLEGFDHLAQALDV